MKFLGSPYPIEKHPMGFFHTQSGIDQIKSDLLILLLTNPGERVMLPTFGTPLRRLVFEPNDTTLQMTARDMIISAIEMWEPRIVVDAIEVGGADLDSLNPADLEEDVDYILSIKIKFFDPQNIQNLQSLTLEVPLTTSNTTDVMPLKKVKDVTNEI